ncbi:MAG: bifunctional glutamate N-acetyltransferase/amino-acid acetyltransferase ArgJ [Pirellulaceae bacterium]
MDISIPAGFQWSAVHCGIKQDASVDDYVLVRCLPQTVAAGVYTRNRVFAAPVAWDRSRTPSGDIRVVVVNSGNANACTGDQGWQDVQAMALSAAEACDAGAEQALVMSTGIIGEFLPMQKILPAARQAAACLADDEVAFMAAARGILTTDQGPKVSSTTVEMDGQTICLAGMAKGAGMIGPDMATMLAMVMTDAALEPAAAQAILSQAIERSFNCISVEGHTSTNDTVLLLASGAHGQQPLSGAALEEFARALDAVCVELAKQIPADGEGASHLITIDVQGAASREDARQIAQTIANSNLVKAGVAGADPNWGRIISAVGYAGVEIDPDRVRVAINGFDLYQDGAPVPFDVAEVSSSIAGNAETSIVVAIGNGEAAARFWTSDLTADYVRFNSEFHT